MENTVAFNYPKQIKEYKIETIIGSGAYGTVFEATHSNGEKVAIKILNKLILGQNPDDFALINSEIELLKKLYHKNIIRLLEFIEDTYFIYIVTELCDEGELFDYIVRKQKLSEAEALSIFQELIDALIYIHGMEICHRDIKPDNILLTNGRKIKLIDFGFAIKYNSEDFLSDPLGTPPYACPEIHKSNKYHGASADIWSTGVVLFVMVCGYLPFGDEGDDEEKISSSIQKGEFEIPDTLSSHLIDLIIHLLEIDPCQRYDFEQITQHCWFNANKPVLTGGINLDIIRYPIDEEIIDICKECGLNQDEVRNDLLLNIFNERTAIYKMILQQMIKLDKESRSDLFSEEYKAYLLDDHNYIKDEIDDDIKCNEEPMKKTPSGNNFLEVFPVRYYSSQKNIKDKSFTCSECGRRIRLMIESNPNGNKRFENIKMVSNENNFSISNVKPLKEIQDEDQVIQLIEFKNEEMDNSDDSIITESSNFNKMMTDQEIPNNSTSSIKQKSCFKKTKGSQIIHQNKQITFTSPIKQKRHLFSKTKSGINKTEKHIEINSPERKKHIPCVISNGWLASMNKDTNSNTIMTYHGYNTKNNKAFNDSSNVFIKKTKTLKNNVSQINEVSRVKNNDISFDDTRERSPIPVRNISYSPKLGKLNCETRMTMLPWVKKKIIIDNQQGIEVYTAYINRFNKMTIFNTQAKVLKAQIQPSKLIKVKSMHNKQIYSSNGNFDKKTSQKLLQKFPSKTKMQRIKESKSRFMTNLSIKK